MEIPLGGAIGVLFFVATLLMLEKELIRLVIGLSILSNGVNLLLFLSGGLTRGEPPVLRGGSGLDVANPLPQALILTAIVISFGLQTFAVALAYRAHSEYGTLQIDRIGEAAEEDLR